MELRHTKVHAVTLLCAESVGYPQCSDLKPELESPMERFSVLFPSLSAFVSAGLQTEGDVDLARTIGGHGVRRVTYDRSCNAGYIYLGTDTALVGYTICLSTYPESLVDMVNVDVAHDGSAFGVEVFPIDPQLRAAIEDAVRS